MIDGSEWGLQDISYRPMGALIWDCYYSSPAPRAKVLCHFFIYSAGPHGGIYPQTDSGTGRLRDWISLFTKHGSYTPVFALNLRLTPCCPFCLPVVLNAIPNFLFFFFFKGGQFSLLKDVIIAVKRYISEQRDTWGHMKVELVQVQL